MSFVVGDRVRIRTTPTWNSRNPRTPRYARGHVGVIVQEYGVVVNPLDHHEPYPPMYTVEFEGSELWGEGTSHSVRAEIHEEWLDPLTD